MYPPGYNHDGYMTVPKLGNLMYRYGLKERIMELKDYSNRAFLKKPFLTNKQISSKCLGWENSCLSTL